MKVLCPICGKEGIVEQRGKSVRIIHYGYVGGERIFVKHTIKERGYWVWLKS